jgi:putative transcription factor
MSTTDKKSSWTHCIHDKRDWEPLSWDKRGEKKSGESNASHLNRSARAGITTTKTRPSKPIDEIISLKKIENEEETFKHAKVTLSLSRKIAQARNEKKLTQKDLANAICVPPKTIQEYESGKAIPNHLIINKMEKFLGCKLR